MWTAWLRAGLVAYQQVVRSGATIYAGLMRVLPTVLLVLAWWRERRRIRRRRK